MFSPLADLFFFRSRSLADERKRGGDTPMPVLAGWLAFVGPGGAQPLLRHASPSPKPCVPLLRAAAAATHTATPVCARALRAAPQPSEG